MDSGRVTVKFMYHFLENCFLTREVEGILHCIWDGNMTLKIKCFGWLCINKKIQTWDVLQKHGFIGPRWCCLCQSDKESTLHIFGNCIFF